MNKLLLKLLIFKILSFALPFNVSANQIDYETVLENIKTYSELVSAGDIDINNNINFGDVPTCVNRDCEWEGEEYVRLVWGCASHAGTLVLAANSDFTLKQLNGPFFGKYLKIFLTLIALAIPTVTANQILMVIATGGCGIGLKRTYSEIQKEIRQCYERKEDIARIQQLESFLRGLERESKLYPK